MISIYLISRGVRLQRSSYTQNGVTKRELRRSIAYVISQANELLPTVSVARHLITRRQATTTRVKAKRKQRKESRKVPGSKKARTDEGPNLKFICSTHKPLVNKKRGAKSLTDRHPTQLTLNQVFSRRSKNAQKKGKEIICKL